MKTTHIKTRIRMAIGIIGAGYVALLLLVYWTGTRTQKSMNLASGSLFPATLSSQEAGAGFQKLTKSYSDAVLTQDASALGKADEAAQAVTASLQSIEQDVAGDPVRKQQVADLLAKFTDLASRSRTVYAAMASGGTNISADTQSQIGGLARENHAMEDSLGQLRTVLSADFKAQLDSVTTWTTRQRVFGLILFLVMATCAGMMTVMVERRVSGPLLQVTARLKDVAEGEGDLTQRIPITAQDEIGELSHWFNTFLEKLQGIIRQVQDNTRQLAEACEGISTSSGEMAKGAEEQQAQAGQVATAMQEMSVTVQEISRNSNSAAETAHGSAEDAREGGKVMGHTIAMMQRVTASVDQAAKQVAELGNRSDQIGRIVGVIKEIAEQTNLLALNAAIEAARAGEHGRGFAVVAGEVRNLAERTTKATQEIATMIGSIQTETKGAVEAMVRGTGEVQQGVKAAEESGAKLQRIIEGAQQAADAVAQIATAATEQASTTDEVNRNITEIARISDDFAAGAKKSANSSESLSQLAVELDSLVSRFKVENGQGTGGMRGPAERFERRERPVAGPARVALNMN
jgi:methyl-accepting chemotaxis protein